MYVLAGVDKYVLALYACAQVVYVGRIQVDQHSPGHGGAIGYFDVASCVDVEHIARYHARQKSPGVAQVAGFSYGIDLGDQYLLCGAVC